MTNLYQLLLVAALAPGLGTHSVAQEEEDILETSLESLLDFQISTAAKYAQSLSRAPASVTLITSDDIERYGYQTLEDVMSHVRGFYVSYDRNYNYLGVRGFSRPTDYNNRILLLINGHSNNENIYGSAAIGTEFALDLDAVERIEIVRGPGAALYGTSAMFAVVNVITKEGRAIDGLKFSAQTGSYGRLQGSAAFGKEFASGLDIAVSSRWTDIAGQDLYYKEYDDPSTNNGIAKGLDWDKHYGLLTTIAYEDLTLQGYMSSREKAYPTGAWQVNFNDPATKTLDVHSFVELKYDRQAGPDKRIMLRGYFDHFVYEGSYGYDLLWNDSSDGDWLGGELQFLWDLRANNRLTVGAEYQDHLRADYISWDAETTYFDDDFPFGVLSFYLQDEHQATENLILITFVIGLISLFILLYFLARQEEREISAVADKAQSIVEMTAFIISPALSFEDVETLEKALRGARINEDLIYVIVVDAKGVVVANFNTEVADESSIDRTQRRRGDISGRPGI
jgi:hypothetical protein